LMREPQSPFCTLTNKIIVSKELNLIFTGQSAVVKKGDRFQYQTYLCIL
jgi:hypothetical protein